MKTKIFFLLAAIMLSCASAFAQSGNSDPLKGDVNGDGVVDVADIVAVIDIMKNGGGTDEEKQAYWYAGTNGGNAVTADNFTDVASKIPESEIPAAGFVTANGQYVYIVLPETRHIESLTDVNNADVEFTCTDVMGYHIYKTTELINTQINYTITQTVYYWYVGTTQPTDPTNSAQNSGLNKWTSLGTTLPTSSIKVAKSDDTNYADHTWYIAAPTAANFTLYNATNVASDEATWNKSTFNIGSVSYTLWTSKDQGWQAVEYLHK